MAVADMVLIPFVKQCLAMNWLGRQDSNLRMLGSKPSALPLGDAPINSVRVGVTPIAGNG